MSDYTVTTDFSAKDALATGDANKLISGVPLDTEFANIATAIATKANITAEGAAFLATPSSDQTIASTSTWTDVDFQTEVYDLGTDYVNPNFTFPATGLYLISWFIITSTQVTDGKLVQSRLYNTTSATPIASGSVHRQGASSVYLLNASVVVKGTAADAVKVQVWQDEQASFVLDAANTGATGQGTMFFAAVRLT